MVELTQKELIRELIEKIKHLEKINDIQENTINTNFETIEECLKVIENLKEKNKEIKENLDLSHLKIRELKKDVDYFKTLYNNEHEIVIKLIDDVVKKDLKIYELESELEEFYEEDVEEYSTNWEEDKANLRMGF